MQNLLILTFASAVAIGLGTSSAEVVMLGAVKDNTLYSESGAVSNGAGEFIFAGSAVNGNLRRSLIAFDISSIAAGSTINSVTLSLEMNRTIAASEDVTLHRLLADWGEGASEAPGEEGAGAAAMLGDATWSNSFFGGAGAMAWVTPGGILTRSPVRSKPLGEMVPMDGAVLGSSPTCRDGSMGEGLRITDGF